MELAKIQDLQKAYAESRQAVNREIAFQKRIADDIDATRLAGRPTYPTPEQLAGLEIAIERVLEGFPSEAIHGDPCGPFPDPHIVTVSPGFTGHIVVFDRAPSQFQGMRALWMMSDEEIDKILELVRTRLTVIKWWRHSSGGVAMHTAPKTRDDA